MTSPLPLSRSSSSRAALTIAGVMTTTITASSACRLNEGLTLCTEDSPCEICKDWLPEAWQAQAKANEQKRRRSAAKAAKKSQERETMDDSVEIHAPEEVLQLPAKPFTEGSSKSKGAKTATSSGSKATEVEQSTVRPSRSCEPKKSVASSVSVVGRPSSDRSERHRSRSGDRKRRSHGSDRRQDSPRHHASRHDSGRQEGERSRPTSSGGSSSRRQADSTGGSGSSCVSRATDVRPSASSSHAHHHHRKSSGDRRSLSSSSPRASADLKSPPGHDHERVLKGLVHHTSPDGKYSCPWPLPSHQRREP